MKFWITARWASRSPAAATLAMGTAPVNHQRAISPPKPSQWGVGHAAADLPGAGRGSIAGHHSTERAADTGRSTPYSVQQQQRIGGGPASPPAMKGGTRFALKPRRTVKAAGNWPVGAPRPVTPPPAAAAAQLELGTTRLKPKPEALQKPAP